MTFDRHHTEYLSGASCPSIQKPNTRVASCEQERFCSLSHHISRRICTVDQKLFTAPAFVALLAAGACGGQVHDGTASGGANEPGSGGTEPGPDTGGASTGGAAAEGSGGADTAGSGGGGEPGSGGEGPALPLGCVPLQLQADGTYAAEVTIDEEDPVEFFTSWGSHSERVCGYFENSDRIRVTAVPGSAPSLINFVLDVGAETIFSDEREVQIERLVERSDLPLRAPVLEQIVVGGIRGALDLGNIRVIVEVLERFCEPESQLLYGDSGYRDDRAAEGFFGHYVAHASPGAELCSPPLSGQSACVAGHAPEGEFLSVVTYLAQEQGGQPALWTPGEEFVGVAYDRSKGIKVGLTDGERIWWDRRSKATPWNEALWADFQSDDGIVYAREPLLAMIQRPSETSSSGKVSFCARPLAPVLAAGSRPDCQWLQPGENVITIFGANQASGLMCFFAEQAQTLHMEFWGGPEIFYFDHMGPESSYFGPVVNHYGGMFSEWSPRHYFDIEVQPGPNGFVVSDFRSQLQYDDEVLLNLSITTP